MNSVLSGAYTDTGTYSDTGLTNGTTYYYVVCGVNLLGAGPNSSQVSATPNAFNADILGLAGC